MAFLNGFSIIKGGLIRVRVSDSMARAIGDRTVPVKVTQKVVGTATVGKDEFQQGTFKEQFDRLLKGIKG